MPHMYRHPRCMVPGDVSRDVHELCVSPWDCPKCLLGWQKDTYMPLFERPEVPPTPSWQTGRFPAAQRPHSTTPPGSPGTEDAHIFSFTPQMLKQ